MKILSHQKIIQKIKRLSAEIIENNFAEEKLALVGINRMGFKLAQLIHHEIVQSNHKLKVELYNVRINPKSPTEYIAFLEDHDLRILEGKSIVLIDDVANTGRTSLHCIVPFLKLNPSKIEVAVLVDRMHKSYPISVKYVGLSLATTLKEHIDVDLNTENDFTVSLL